MPNIFICHRPEDTAAYAGRLRERLVATFGEGSVAMTIDEQDLSPGSIRRFLSKFDVMLVVIGALWAKVDDESGKRWIDDPNDPVRLVIATGLTDLMAVIPVEVGGGRRPPSAGLPVDLRDLTRLTGVGLSDEQWTEDVDWLIRSVAPLKTRISFDSDDSHTRSQASQSATSGSPLPPARQEVREVREIFISYVKEDGSKVSELAKELRALQLSTWTYEEDGVPGVSHLTQVYDAIEACRAFVLIASPKSIKSHEVITEAEAAHQGRKMIIPVRIGLTHEQFKASHKILRMATGTAVSSSLDDRGAAEIAKRIASALKLAGRQEKT